MVLTTSLDFGESSLIVTEQENSSQDDEDECAADESLRNENLHPPNSNNHSILSRDGAVRENRPPNADGRTSSVTLFEPDQEQNNLFLLELIRYWMFLMSCGVIKTWNVFSAKCSLSVHAKHKQQKTT